ncbi:hypothetical protein BA895_14275 [Humibacillus sp. DSM 29435]|uniref:hypothetical protein n=1 Tax=Humibacillus sp. DSM 29435 TaxID=1869167 RepID=UPI00087301F4|nr:hypothetical protein [Humibacillus sp. DSM 29435]OFE17938.1 hypothetical protein BA895_14275 [Humibacillus sp. DSM 29435]
MFARTTKKLALAAAISGLATFGLAVPAQAATTVTHDGCTLEVDPPIFTNHFSTTGAKLFDYPYHLTCLPSAAGVTVTVTHERWESDILGRAGDPDAPDEFTGRSKRNLVFAAAGQTRNMTVRAVLPTVNDDTDIPLEMYQTATFRVKSGAVLGTTSPKAVGASTPLIP